MHRTALEALFAEKSHRCAFILLLNIVVFILQVIHNYDGFARVFLLVASDLVCNYNYNCCCLNMFFPP